MTTDEKLVELSKTSISETTKKELQHEMHVRFATQTKQLMDDIESAIYGGEPTCCPEDIPMMTPEETLETIKGIKTSTRKKKLNDGERKG